MELAAEIVTFYNRVRISPVTNIVAIRYGRIKLAIPRSKTISKLDLLREFARITAGAFYFFELIFKIRNSVCVGKTSVCLFNPRIPKFAT